MGAREGPQHHTGPRTSAGVLGAQLPRRQLEARAQPLGREQTRRKPSRRLPRPTASARDLGNSSTPSAPGGDPRKAAPHGGRGVTEPDPSDTPPPPPDRVVAAALHQPERCPEGGGGHLHIRVPAAPTAPPPPQLVEAHGAASRRCAAAPNPRLRCSMTHSERGGATKAAPRARRRGGVAWRKGGVASGGGAERACPARSRPRGVRDVRWRR